MSDSRAKSTSSEPPTAKASTRPQHQHQQQQPQKQNNAAATLRPLAPKPSWPPPPQPLAGRASTPQSSGTSGSRRRSPASTACAVCYRSGCQLPTHTAFSTLSLSSTSSSPERPAIRPDNVFSSSYAYGIARQLVDPDIAASRTEPFYQLPLADEMNTPEMHRLFHSWFTVESRDFFDVPRPPDIVGDLICGPFFWPAMQDPLLCLSVLAASAAGGPRRSGQQTGNVKSLTLLGQAIQQMQERLKSDPAHISDTTIVAAVFLWITNIFLEDTDAMTSHSKSIYAFVETRGGLKELGLVGAVARFIRWADIIHSFILPVPCHYLDIPDPSPTLPSLPPPPARYGSFWENLAGVPNPRIDSAVIKACQDTCRLLELLEEAEIKGISGAEYTRMIQRICSLYNRGSLLRARNNSDKLINECVNVASALVQFHCFCGLQMLRIVARTNVARLVTAIKATGGLTFWKQDLDLLIWVLFVVAVIPVRLEEKSWCFSFLCHVSTTRFGRDGNLKRQWRQELKACLQQFIWCDSRLEQFFKTTCQAIEAEVESDQDEDGTSDGI